MPHHYKVIILQLKKKMSDGKKKNFQAIDHISS